MTRRSYVRRTIAFATLLFCGVAGIGPAGAATYSIIHTFKSVAGGAGPGPLLLDKTGHLWGATSSGGKPRGGVFFELKPPTAGQTRWRFHPVVTFTAATGTYPFGQFAEQNGNFIGPTSEGGPDHGGVVYDISASGTITDLHSFASSVPPPGAVATDTAGNLYGEAIFEFIGGETGDSLFKITPDKTFSTLYTFDPKYVLYPGLLVEKSGGLVGTAFNSGKSDPGFIFRLTPAGTLQTLYHFTGGADGDGPTGPLVADSAGNLYGTTQGGGIDNSGTVFKLATDGTLRVLHSFSRNTGEGWLSQAGVALDAAGNVYGTTSAGGDYGFGTVFEIASDGTETVLHSFAGGTDGETPQYPVVIGRQGQVYGSTQFGGHNEGIAFEIIP